MIRVNLKIRKSAEKSIRTLNDIEQDIQSHIMDLGKETEEKIVETIEGNKVRPQAGEPKTLEENMEVEYFQEHGKFGWGVGNVDKLNQNAPYWRALNYGSSHMVGKRLPPGEFHPGSPEPNAQNWRDGRWKEGGNYSPIVKRPIQPTNYIERTQVWLKSKISGIISILRRR